MLKTLEIIANCLLGFDAFCFNKKFLVFNLVDRNLKVKYRRSFLGFFWTILSPLAMSAIYYFVFKSILHIERPHYLPFILSGVLPWSFFAQSLSESTESIVANQALISKIPIPIHIFPYVVTLTNFSTLLFALPVIFVLAILSGVSVGLNMLWVLYFFAALLILGYSIGAVLSIFFVYLRDLRHAVTLLLQIWFYATPIIYDSSMIPQKYFWLLYLNPVGSIFEGIHESMMGTSGTLYMHVLASFLWCAFFLLILRITFSRLRTGLVERL